MVDNNSKNKRILGVVVFAVYFVMLLGTLVVVYYDPFFHFHGPIEGERYIIHNQAYQNPGIARNFDYDSLIVGSSMTELLFPSLFDKEYGCRAVKTPYSGGSIKNANIILQQAFSHHKGKIEYVFWGLDPYAFNIDVDQVKQELPQYLYNDSILDDMSYLNNKEVLKYIVENWKNGETIDYDTMYDNIGKEMFCQQAALSYVDDEKYENITGENLKSRELEPDKEIVDNISQNVTPIVSGNPNTKFIFFIPPYPIIHWLNYDADSLSQLVCNIDYIYKELSKSSNTELHMLQLMGNTDNLYMYKDNYHYSFRMSEDISGALKSREYELNADNVEEQLERFYSYVQCYDYSIYSGERYSFQKEINLAEYLDATYQSDIVRIAIVSENIGNLNYEEIKALKNYGLLDESYAGGNSVVVARDDDTIRNRLTEVLSSAGAHTKVVNKEFIINCSSEDGMTATSCMCDGIEYIAEPKLLMIVAIDANTGRVVDVAGLREDTRELVKY